MFFGADASSSAISLYLVLKNILEPNCGGGRGCAKTLCRAQAAEPLALGE